MRATSKPIYVHVESIAQAQLDECTMRDTDDPHPGHTCPPTLADSLGATGSLAAEQLARLTSVLVTLSLDVTGDPPAVHDEFRKIIYAVTEHDLDTVDLVFMLATVAAGARNYERTRPADLIGDEIANARTVIKRESAVLYTDPAVARAAACLAAHTVVRLTRAFTDPASWHSLRVSTAADYTTESPMRPPTST